MAQFGWSFLSRAALREAESRMLDGHAGVRDEIGFLLVHQRYADRFFPGTSVLHTRLRYALFVPWLYNELREQVASGLAAGKVRAAVDRAELRLTGRLLRSDPDGKGVIGGGVHRQQRNSSQPPSFVYWTALTEWGLLRRRGDLRAYSRAQVERLLPASGRGTALRDDDGAPLASLDWPFDCELPPPPDWRGDGPLDFQLRPEEARYLAERLRATRSAAHGGRSLLSRLVGEKLAGIEHCWELDGHRAAQAEREPLRRAGQAAALAAIGRGLYAAQAETLRERDGLQTDDVHRPVLPDLLEQWRAQALALDRAALEADLGPLPREVGAVIAETLRWLRGPAKDPLQADLLAAYRCAEIKRKTGRARLSDTLDGKARRQEWDYHRHSRGDALHYRWGNVVRLLADLEQAA